MKFLVHQSICGEVNKAWGLIKTTMPDINLAKNIAFRADLQDQTGGVMWVPAIRGFFEGEYFLIMKTFEDLSPEVRRGRKFSHVLIILKKDILGIEDIGQIINLLPDKIEKDVVLKSIQVEYKNKVDPDLISSTFQGRFSKLINGYVNVKNYKNTLIWIGQENFSLAVIELWKRLIEQERQSFQFGISFNNDDKIVEGINLVSVPESVQSKFLRSDFCIIAKNDNHKPVELIEQLLIGDSSVKQRIENFEKVIGSNSLSRDDINFVAKGLDTFEKMEDVVDIKRLNTLSHIIAKFAPADDQGNDFKQKLLVKIIQLIDAGQFSDIVILKNFRTESYQNSTVLLSEALTKWIRKNIFSIRKTSNDLKLFFDNLKSNNLNWWDKLIEIELRLYLKTISVSKVVVVYMWLMESPLLLSKIVGFISQSKESESCFIEKLPKNLSQLIFEELKVFSLNNGWLRLYAQNLNFQLELHYALTELLKVDKDSSHFDAIDIIVKGKNEGSIIDYAVRNGDMRMIKIAGKICSKSPKNLNKLKILDANWQKIWLEAILTGNEIETGLKEPDKEISKLFDSLILGANISEELIDKISQSEHGNILFYPNRSELWKKISDNAKNNFLTKTSAALLNQLSLNSNTVIPDDVFIINHISQKGVWDFLFFNRNNIKSVIPIFDKLNLQDINLKDYLSNYTGHINAVEATQLGKLIAVKRFSSSAYIINSKASKRNNWKFALAECHYLLDFITKAALVISGTISSVNIPTDEWWQSTEELIVELYPNGTALTTIWKKAGGKESDLLTKSTANEIWSDALYKVRRNQLKKITMNKLLKEIEKQYGDNKKFKIIYGLRKNYIKT